METVKRMRACLATVALSSLVVGSVHAAEPPDDSASVDAGPMRIYFIGNSHTARNGGLDWHIENLAASEETPRTVEGSSETASGATLQYHYSNGATSRIRTGQYDVVVLQGHLPGSLTRSSAPFLEYSRRFDEVIRETGARTVFFMSWPQGRYGNWAGLDDIVAAHRQVESELDADVAPVALAMERARAERPDLELIGEDTIHATWAGAYLSAVVVYATLFDRSPEGLPYHFGISDEDADFLQRIAWQEVLDWRAGSPSG